jgi:hypothetical protein
MLLRPVLSSLALATLAAALSAAPGAWGQTPAPATPARPSEKVKPATPNDLELRPGLMQLVTDEQSGGRYWVFTYSVVNRTGKTQRFSPRFDLLMGDGAILEAGRGVPVEVARRLRVACASPQALDQFQVMGDVLDGEANAKDGFVVWPAKGDAKQFTLFIAGPSQAFDRVDQPDGTKKIVRRTWCRDFSAPGTADPRVTAEAGFDPIRDRWIMR